MGRTLLAILALVVILAIAAVATGYVNLTGKKGEMPSVAVSGGKLPSVDADVGSIDVGSKNTSIDVPKVDVGTKKEEVKVPTVDVKKPGQ